mmetsp:Transcript_36307/g.44380  ORF Transcript_36307/g.44380 Transcript_36307/m.44380 type:complete len:98 (+) Transcript_36307:154-447(+)
MTCTTQEEFAAEVEMLAKGIVKKKMRQDEVNNCSKDVIRVYSFEPDIYVFDNDFTLTTRANDGISENNGNASGHSIKKSRKNRFGCFSRRRISSVER